MEKNLVFIIIYLMLRPTSGTNFLWQTTHQRIEQEHDQLGGKAPWTQRLGGAFKKHTHFEMDFYASCIGIDLMVIYWDLSDIYWVLMKSIY
jgi:hypothetical protein